MFTSQTPCIGRNREGSTIANAALAHILGHDRVEAHGDDADHLAKWLTDDVAPSHQDARLRCADGTYRWMRRAGPAVDGYTPVVDITDLMQSRAHMQAAVESLPDLLFELDGDARYLAYYSPAERLFAPPEAFMGRTVSDIMPDPLGGQLTAAIQATANGDLSEPIRYSLPMPTGMAHFEARFSLSPRGTVITVIREMTLLVEYEEALTRQNRVLDRRNRELEQLSFAAAHDLRGPSLHVVQFLQRLATETEDTLPDGAKTLLGFGTTAARKLFARVEGLNHLSQLDQHTFVRTSVDLADLTQQTWDRLNTDDATLTIEGSATVPGDAHLLTTLLRVLLDNATTYRYPERDCAVTVRLTQDESGVQIAVRDTGIGIAPEHHDRVFDLFQRLHLDRDIPGIGVGLVMARRVAARHGGTIVLRSDGKSGSTFEVTLPVRTPETAT